MLKAIKDFFEQRMAAPANAPPDEHRLRLATAALLAEVMRLDGQSEAERTAAVGTVVDVLEATAISQFLLGRHADALASARCWILR